MALVFEAGHKAYLDERQVGSSKQAFCAFDALLHQVMLRRKAGAFTEGPGKVVVAETGNAGDLGEA